MSPKSRNLHSPVNTCVWQFFCQMDLDVTVQVQEPVIPSQYAKLGGYSLWTEVVIALYERIVMFSRDVMWPVNSPVIQKYD